MPGIFPCGAPVAHSEYVNPSIPFTRNGLEGLNCPLLCVEKASQPKASAQNPARRNPLALKRGAPATVLTSTTGRVASHYAKLPVSTDILLSGLREAQEEGVIPLMLRRTLYAPLLREHLQEAELGAGKLLH